MPLVLNGATSGATTLQPTDATTQTITLPANSGTIVTTASTGGVSQAMLASGVAGNGPAFSATPGSSTSASAGVATKITCNTEQFDTNNCFDTTNYRFTPTVAGYYQFNGIVRTNNAGTGEFTAILNKSGSGGYLQGSNSARTDININISQVAGIYYMNGTTDYVELWIYSSQACTIPAGTATVLSGALVRAA